MEPPACANATRDAQDRRTGIVPGGRVEYQSLELQGRVRTVGRLASFRKCAADVSSLLAGKTERRGGGVFDQGHTAHGTTNDGPGGHHREPTAEKIAAGDVERSGHQPTRPCGESATQSTPVDD